MPEYSQNQLDAIARERGFSDYATWAAWEKHRSQSLRGANTVAPAPKNWLQGLIDQIPIHPSYLFNYVGDKYGKATGQR